MEIVRVVVLDSRPVAEDIVNELIVNQTLLLRKRYTWMAGSFTSIVSWTRRPPTT
jgi:hypothetical protein